MSLDLTVHHRNAKSRKIESVTPIRVHFSGTARMFEKPAGSGNWFYESGDAIPAEKVAMILKEVQLGNVTVTQTQEQKIAAMNEKIAELARENEKLKAAEAKVAQKAPAK